MKPFEQHKNGQELRGPRNLAEARGTFQTEEAEKGCSPEQTKKDQTMLRQTNL